MTTPSLFNRRARRLRRDRAVRSGGDAFLHELAFDELLDRLKDVRRAFDRALLVGCVWPEAKERLAATVRSLVVVDPSPEAARRSGGLVCDEDRLPFADAAFDLILCVGTLDTVDDLPGALLLLRRALRPDGLFLGAMSAAGSLPRLRGAMAAADAVAGAAAPRMHPGIDVRTAGDLLARAGFSLPVADLVGLDVSYAGLKALVSDLRAHGATNILTRRSTAFVGRAGWSAAVEDFQSQAVQGRTTERIEILYLTGWRPPAPA